MKFNELCTVYPARNVYCGVGCVQEDLFSLLKGVCEEEPEVTHTEKMLAQIMKDDPQSFRDHPSWKHPVLTFSAVPLQSSLLTLPLADLKPRTKSLSRELMEFINTPLEEATIDHHIALAQKIIGQGLTHPYFQDEIYCQLLRQLSGRTSQTVSPVIQVGKLTLNEYCPSPAHLVHEMCSVHACFKTIHTLNEIDFTQFASIIVY